VEASHVIITLKVAVISVTLVFIASLVAIVRGNQRLHGRLNLAFFTLTLITVLGFEVLIQLIRPDLFDYIKQHEELARTLRIHLCFSVPSAVVMPAMLYTGLTHRRNVHVVLAVLFTILWVGTFITGVFFIPMQ
jgi:uncharacterized membrane protein YozB (DUF420 family)